MTTIQDGTVQFVVRDKRLATLQQMVFDMANPIGKVLTMGIADDLSTVFAEYINNGVNIGTWKEVAQDRVLQGGTNVGSTVEAGLPNITGEMAIGKNAEIAMSWGNGVFSLGDYNYGMQAASKASGVGKHTMKFNASLSNSIYGNSDTVQPPAYIVKFWKRTA